MPFNREIPATRVQIFGPFLIARDAPGGLHLFSPLELENILDAFCPELLQEKFPSLRKLKVIIYLTHPKGCAIILYEFSELS
ncbi:hypothetical protein B1R32_11855 [Abditibacterium utsteinense]|uniref:Uncharacterized protein n=1 Tax=Abditibacterium utsteinense TaxID=1960156 RepID=A0A2S8SQ87_9BACT|nr:hypothetical protein B1R32_11855 [Abditibacterium utsteinense]